MLLSFEIFLLEDIFINLLFVVKIIIETIVLNVNLTNSTHCISLLDIYIPIPAVIILKVDNITRIDTQ